MQVAARNGPDWGSVGGRPRVECEAEAFDADEASSTWRVGRRDRRRADFVQGRLSVLNRPTTPQTRRRLQLQLPDNFQPNCK
jgi:hypothetical protein